MLKKLFVFACLSATPLFAGHDIHNAMWLHPEHLDYSIADAIRISEEAGVKKHAVILHIDPASKDPMSAVELSAAAFEKMRDALNEKNITAGIWVGCMLGHGWDGEMVPECGWTEIVNETGVTAHRVCMLDENFREYVKKCFIRLAKTRPAFLLIDDDMRTINNSQKGAECFCPLHVAIYNQRSGLDLSAQEWIQKVKTCPADDPAVKVFEEVRRETFLGFAKMIREAIDTVDPDLPCGLCCSGAEYLLGGEVTRILAGKNPSFMRINNASYMEGDPKFFHECMFHTAYKSDIARPVDVLLSEDDTWPHNRFSKSAKSFHTHICGSIINGTNGALVMLSDYRNRNDKAVAAYRAVMGEHKGYYDALLEEVKTVKWLGLMAPTFPADRYFHPGRGPQYLIPDMQMSMMSRYGFPCMYGKISKDFVNVLSTETVAFLTDEELKTALSTRAIVDGGAALLIAKRGLADLLGVTPVEHPYRAGWAVPEGSEEKMPFFNDFTLPLLSDPAPGAKMLSGVRLATFRNTGVDHFVAPGSFFYQNRLGGKVVTLAVRGNGEILNIIDPTRKFFIAGALRMIDPESLPVFAATDHDVWIKVGKKEDGGLLVALVNLSFDEFRPIELDVNKIPAKVSVLGKNGQWEAVDFEVKGDHRISIAASSPCYEFVALKLE
ncbi:MAG: hypothetical protein MJ016_06960 [Victivallaceae bacterium]|nr:hypothetical protein [Victivallaceae bacterium]